jgi:hypothetical protein
MFGVTSFGNAFASPPQENGLREESREENAGQNRSVQAKRSLRASFTGLEA